MRRPDIDLEAWFDLIAVWIVLGLVVVLWLVVVIDAYRGMVAH